jgi:heptosyltransferase-1
VIRLGALGDVVRTLPAVSALRAAYPRAHLAWMVEPGSAGVLEHQGWIDEVLVFPRAGLLESLRRGRWLRAAREATGFVGMVRSRRFDLVLDFHSILKSGILSALSAGGRRIGYAAPYGRELSWAFARERARLHPRRVSRFERNDALVRYLGVTTVPAARPLEPPAAALRRVEAELGTGPAPVAIHPGTSDATPYKRWTPTGYAAVARALRDQCGRSSLVTVGPARHDREFAEAVVKAAAGAAAIAPATPRIGDLMALFSRCSLYVGSDTGPMHVASLVGTPVVQLLGPTDPVENAPWEATPSRTLRVQIGCNPCRRGCAAATCMQVIDPERVVEAARSLLYAPEARW